MKRRRGHGGPSVVGALVFLGLAGILLLNILFGGGGRSGATDRPRLLGEHLATEVGDEDLRFAALQVRPDDPRAIVQWWAGDAVRNARLVEVDLSAGTFSSIEPVAGPGVSDPPLTRFPNLAAPLPGGRVVMNGANERLLMVGDDGVARLAVPELGDEPGLWSEVDDAWYGAVDHPQMVSPSGTRMLFATLADDGESVERWVLDLGTMVRTPVVGWEKTSRDAGPYVNAIEWRSDDEVVLAVHAKGVRRIRIGTDVARVEPGPASPADGQFIGLVGGRPVRLDRGSSSCFWGDAQLAAEDGAALDGAVAFSAVGGDDTRLVILDRRASQEADVSILHVFGVDGRRTHTLRLDEDEQIADSRRTVSWSSAGPAWRHPLAEGPALDLLMLHHDLGLLRLREVDGDVRIEAVLLERAAGAE